MKEKIRGAMVTNIEEVISRGETGLLIEGLASSAEAVLELGQNFGDAMGLEFDPANAWCDKRKKNSSTFGFSSFSWTATWEPTGPTPNWRIPPPEDPSHN